MKPYVCVDCDYADHFRFQQTRDVDAAAGAWLRCLAHSRAQEQDGIVKAVWARRTFAATFERIDELVAVGLLMVREDGDYELRSYAPRNQTSQMLEQSRTLARERKLAWQAQRAAATSKADKSSPSAPLALVGASTAAVAASKRRTNASPRGDGTVEERGKNAFVPTSTSLSTSISTSTSPSTSPSDPYSVNNNTEIQRGGTGGDDAPPRTLPASERGVSGTFWLRAFTDGVTDHTKRPCTAGRVYVATLERLVTHHAPQRDAPSACTWLREQARAFAAQWEGKHPAKRLTPDGLERWLNDGRQGPPEFGKPRIVQPSVEEWHEDDWSDLGAEVVR